MSRFSGLGIRFLNLLIGFAWPLGAKLGFGLVGLVGGDS